MEDSTTAVNKPLIKEETYVLNGKNVKMSETSLTTELIWDLAENGWADYTCKNCGYATNVDIHVSVTYNYCPYCGAKVINNKRPMKFWSHKPWEREE